MGHIYKQNASKLSQNKTKQLVFEAQSHYRCVCVVYQSLIEIMSNCNPNINWNINHRVVYVSQNREIYCEIKTFRQNHPKFSGERKSLIVNDSKYFFFGERSININVHRSKTTLSRESNEYAHTHNTINLLLPTKFIYFPKME